MTLATSPNRYLPWQVRIFSATWLAYFGYYFCRKAFFIVKADIGIALEITSTDLAHLGSAYLAAYIVGQFSSAYFGRVLGPKLLLLAGMGISIACNAAFGAANGFWTIFLFMALNGAAQGTGWPGCIGSLAFWFRRKQRGSILGIWSTCYQLGSLAAGAFAAYLLGRAGWRWSFYGASLVLLAIWFYVLFLHPDRPERVGLDPIPDDEDEPAAAARAGAAGPAEAALGFRGLGWTREVVLSVVMMGCIYFCIKFLRYALWSWAPYFLRKNFGMAGDDAGYLSTVFDLCGFVGVIVAGFVSDRLFKGRRAFLCLAMLAAMTLSFVLMYRLGARSLTSFATTMGMAGFMLYGPDSLLSGVGAIDVGSKRGALVAASVINGMGSIGPVFQEEIVGWLYKASHESLLPVLILLVAVAVIGTLLTAWLWLRARAGKSAL